VAAVGVGTMAGLMDLRAVLATDLTAAQPAG